MFYRRGLSQGPTHYETLHLHAFSDFAVQMIVACGNCLLDGGDDEHFCGEKARLSNLRLPKNIWTFDEPPISGNDKHYAKWCSKRQEKITALFHRILGTPLSRGEFEFRKLKKTIWLGWWTAWDSNRQVALRINSFWNLRTRKIRRNTHPSPVCQRFVRPFPCTPKTLKAPL
jgi:hypothetical protein